MPGSKVKSPWPGCATTLKSGTVQRGGPIKRDWKRKGKTFPSKYSSRHSLLHCSPAQQGREECMQTGNTQHVPVMLQEVLKFLRPGASGYYIDGTLGGGGHTQAILERSAPDGKVLGIDTDAQAITRIKERLSDFVNNGRLVLVHGNFAELARIVHEAGFVSVEGVLLDLGFSSYQVDDPERGFSFSADGPLDMRLDQTQAESAADIVNSASEQELARLEKALPQILDVLSMNKALPVGGQDEPGRSGGRMVTIAFHSLEDRLIKEFMRREAKDCLCPPHVPVCVCGHKARLRLLTPKPVTPAVEEVTANPRARSAKLRAAAIVVGS